MKAANSSHIVAAIFMVLFLQACSQPEPVTSRYISRAEASCDWEGKYLFPIELTDTTATYSTSLVVRYDWLKLCNQPLNLDVYITSPSGECAIERIELPMSDSGMGKRHSFRSVVDGSWPYRKNITVNSKNAGIWKIGIKPSCGETEEAVLGIGFSYKKD